MITTSFLTVFLFKQGLSKTSALSINTWGLGANVAGRITATLVSVKLPSKYLLLILTSLYTLSPIALSFAFHHPHAQYLPLLSCAILHLGVSANYAAHLSFINSRIPVDNTIVGLIYAAGGLVCIFDPIIIGSFIDDWPGIFLILIATHGVINLLGLFIIETSYYIFSRKPAKYFISVE